MFFKRRLRGKDIEGQVNADIQRQSVETLIHYVRNEFFRNSSQFV